jgi:hypothetical protein
VRNYEAAGRQQINDIINFIIARVIVGCERSPKCVCVGDLHCQRVRELMNTQHSVSAWSIKNGRKSLARKKHRHTPAAVYNHFSSPLPHLANIKKPVRTHRRLEIANITSTHTHKERGKQVMEKMEIRRVCRNRFRDVCLSESDICQ